MTLKPRGDDSKLVAGDFRAPANGSQLPAEDALLLADGSVVLSDDSLASRMVPERSRMNLRPSRMVAKSSRMIPDSLRMVLEGPRTGREGGRRKGSRPGRGACASGRSPGDGQATGNHLRRPPRRSAQPARGVRQARRHPRAGVHASLLHALARAEVPQGIGRDRRERDTRRLPQYLPEGRPGRVRRRLPRRPAGDGLPVSDG
jgi:hypothetical protein